MRKILTILILCTLGATVSGQNVPLFGGLSLDADKVWNYNLYERTRWGIGAEWIPFCQKLALKSIMPVVSGHVGYGIKDERWKGGVTATIIKSYQVHDTRSWSISVGYDYNTAGSRNINRYALTDIGSLSSFMSKRMWESYKVGLNYSRDLANGNYSLTAQVFKGGRLFGSNGVLYHCDGDSIPREDGFYLEAAINPFSNLGITAQIRLGRVFPARKNIIRLLLQFDRDYLLGNIALCPFVQLGFTPKNTPYTHIFDIGGTWNVPVFFRNALLTAEPIEFSASTFMFSSVRLYLKKPIYDITISKLFVLGSAPNPFVGFNAAWGILWDEDDLGMLTYEGLALQSPNKGIAELFAGIDGILTWGVLKIGAVIAYRLTPIEASYHYGDPKRDFSILTTVMLKM